MKAKFINESEELIIYNLQIGDIFIIKEEIFTHLKPMDPHASTIYPGKVKVIALPKWNNGNWITIEGNNITSSNNHAMFSTEKFLEFLKEDKIEKIY